MGEICILVCWELEGDEDDDIDTFLICLDYRLLPFFYTLVAFILFFFFFFYRLSQMSVGFRVGSGRVGLRVQIRVWADGIELGSGPKSDPPDLSARNLLPFATIFAPFRSSPPFPSSAAMSAPPSSSSAAAAAQPDGGDDGVPVPKLYFCHLCNRTVTVVLLPSSYPICPNCNDEFLEELENPNPNPNPFSASATGGPTFPAVPDSFFPDPFSFLPFLFPSSSSTSAISSSIDLQDPAFLSPNPSDNPLGGQEFNPMLFLHNHLNNLRSSGAQVQFIIENRGGEGSPGGAFGGPIGNLGDYFIGPGLEQLIQQLAENDPNRYGTPPASKSAIKNLPMVTVSEDLTKSENNQCAICQDNFEIGMEVKQMPCKHVYHADCLLPWLELHNSCPVCRHELPTDDTEYENQRGGGGDGGGGDGGGGGNSGSGGSGSGGSGERTVRRSFSIMLPFPFGSAPGN